MERYTLEEFLERMKKQLERAYPGKRLEPHRATKNNGVTKAGLAIREPGGGISPVIYMDELYAAHLRGAPMGRLLRHAAEAYEAARRIDMKAPDFQDFGAIKDRVCFRLIGREKNGEALKARPHREFLDLAIAYAIELEGEGASAWIANDHLGLWGVGEGELHRLAMGNTPRIFEASISSMDAILAELAGEGSAGQPEPGPDIGTPMYVATNRQRRHGAGALLYGGLCRQFAGRVGGPFYILPSSVHETILIPDSPGLCPEKLRETVREVNATQLSPEDMLSDSVYRYDPDADAIRMA